MTRRFLHDTQKIEQDASLGIEVLAAGLWRTATSSLQQAFEEKLQPPLAPSMHGAYLIPSVARMKTACAACRELDTGKRRALVRQLFTGYNASSDFPGMAFVDDLLDMYPEAKVVLNQRRSAQDWLRSTRASLEFFARWKYALVTFWVPQSYWHHQVCRAYADLARRRFGVEDIFSVELYHRHNQWVRDVCRDRGREVFEWSPDMGWEGLCEFIGREVPQGGFPVSNESKEIAELTQILVWRGLRAWAVVLSVLMLLGAIATWLWR